jgi:hypothetical protein
MFISSTVQRNAKPLACSNRRPRGMLLAHGSSTKHYPLAATILKRRYANCIRHKYPRFRLGQLCCRQPWIVAHISRSVSTTSREGSLALRHSRAVPESSTQLGLQSWLTLICPMCLVLCHPFPKVYRQKRKRSLAQCPAIDQGDRSVQARAAP